jgi:alanine racemase
LREAHLDAVRPGGALYGFRRPGTEGLDLRPVMALRARCVGLRDVPAGDRVSYGGTFVCARPTRLALLPIGYADGLLREFWHDAEVLVRGTRVPVVGLISMNQTLVDVTDAPDVEIGDVVTLLGGDGDARVYAEERNRPGHSVYEVTTLLRTSMVRRVVDPTISDPVRNRRVVDRVRGATPPRDGF